MTDELQAIHSEIEDINTRLDAVTTISQAAAIELLTDRGVISAVQARNMRRVWREHNPLATS